MSLDDLDLSGRTIVVTGGTRGLGAEVSRALAGRGARVRAWYRADHESARRLEAEIRSRGGEIAIADGNLAEPAEIRRLAAALLAAEARIDGLVHAAALGSFKPALALRPAQFDLTMNVGARAFLLLVSQIAAALPDDARIVALSSLGAARVVPSYGAIGVTKAALEALVRELAVELAPRGIRVNAVAAGPVAESSLRLHPGYAEMLQRVTERTPAGRLTSAAEVAAVAAWLFSPLAAGLTGQTLVVDGGLSLVL